MRLFLPAMIELLSVVLITGVALAVAVGVALWREVRADKARRARIAAQQRAGMTFTCRLCGQQISEPQIHYRLWHVVREQGPEDWV